MTETFEVINNIIENDDNVNKPEQKKRGRPRKGAVATTTSEEENKEATPPKKVGRPIAEWRHGPDGKYHSHSADPKYNLRYWHEHYRKPYECNICGKILQSCGSVVHKHQRGMHCQLAKLKKQMAQESPPETATAT